jgi:serine/threonine protein kinase
VHIARCTIAAHAYVYTENNCFLHKTQACKSGRYDRFWAAHLRTCPNFPPQAQDLLNRIFVEDPTRRASFKEILEHPWLQGEKWATADMHVSTVIHYILLVVQCTIFKTCMQALQLSFAHRITPASAATTNLSAGAIIGSSCAC